MNFIFCLFVIGDFLDGKRERQPQKLRLKMPCDRREIVRRGEKGRQWEYPPGKEKPSLNDSVPSQLVCGSCQRKLFHKLPLELRPDASSGRLKDQRAVPFSPGSADVKDGRIWCRGADDDKGQLFMHAKAFEAMCATDSLPCNVKFLLEGEEEIGSPSLYKFCADNKKMLKADIILVSDTSMISMQIPSITCGLRGLTYMEVEVTGPNKDLHSGLFGGAVANPANVLARMVASLIDENGHVTIPGFYDDVRELTAAERKAFNKAPFNLTEYKKALEIGDVEGEAGFTTIERTGIRPSLDVNGIWGGYIEEGTKTVIPSKASAKISMRLVPGQDFKKIAKLFEKHFKAIAPKSVKVKVKFLHGGMPYVAPTDMPAYKAAEKAIADTFGKKPLPFYSGGSIPIISGFENILGIKSLLIGFGLAEDAIHSPNESYGLDQFYKGVETIPLFYKYFAEK